ncbi:bifunctional diaminohydroxyphosphoribosylaminopyrimidine deaminase/5-amino-6-(5-phosphoribosylamino)uracil reductase RibD [Persicobacter sp. CCB-QB2]|uniref:bifunctional diaminohydroxyphosphoribosylaminopyrimidine deaminase/5-amino-6-(5-phosphoribosylamino)uracil reductase RibD n=1 Tax=Persicobacter sp. CCB-QB2 TaxID=1561025 RepID=UPI0006A9B615|nr:bifunctional diaminohydroxyphosphoribosylaminopyrimidine deaminase/5-amino-6-(5-phosphoribosylamino)uracil reductase RibD [Persicobacter sp. CCB-QB2]
MCPSPRSEDQKFMLRAIQLAENGLGATYPNPTVGCVIVHQGKIIGEGWHQRAGEAHAEVNAVASVKDPSLLKESTAYVTLEPCSHFGKTPPCADLLIKHQLRRVVVAATDTNPQVAGTGLNKIQKAGIIVETGVCEAEAREMNRRFFTFMEKKRPYVVLKWAQTADGFVARENFDSKWISNIWSRTLVHKWRTEEQAIMVGKNTAHYDNPSLNARMWTGNDPVRIVIDRHLTLDSGLNLFRGKQPTICYNLTKSDTKGNTTYVAIKEDNFLKAVFDDLYQRKILSVFIEGGAGLLKEILEAELWDEARIFKSQTIFGTGISAPEISGFCQEKHLVNEDNLEIWRSK